jgi:5,10-methylenetetrahydrofolate reductase
MTEQKSNLQKILEKGIFSVTAEIGPPRSANGDLVKKHANELLGFIDAANITDNQTAIVRMSSIAAATLSLGEGVEPIPQMTCRDRNRIAIQSDLLGAHALGLRNILCLSGDHQCFGDHPGSKNVFDIDSIQLVAALNNMKNNGVMISGRITKMPAEFFIGATVNPFADPEELQLIRFEKKVNAGAQFVQTQAIYNVDKFVDWMEKVRKRGLHKRTFILPGVLVNKSLKSIEMTGTVAGMDVPKEFEDRMRAAENVQEEGVKIAIELINKIRKVEGIAGIHIMAVGWESIVPRIVKECGLLPRPIVE